MVCCSMSSAQSNCWCWCRLRTLAAERGAPVVLEASGVQPAQLTAYAGTGIDLISSSAPITRSPWLDLSMRFSLDWT
jgi:nicotinate-nucleotide pyrophosphorylase (carboxylating)